jgi:hypothetical protein
MIKAQKVHEKLRMRAACVPGLNSKCPVQVSAVNKNGGHGLFPQVAFVRCVIESFQTKIDEACKNNGGTNRNPNKATKRQEIIGLHIERFLLQGRLRGGQHNRSIVPSMREGNALGHAIYAASPIVDCDIKVRHFPLQESGPLLSCGITGSMVVKVFRQELK